MDISVEIVRLIDEIRDNKTDGASELARQAAAILKTAAEHSRAENAEEFILEQAEIGEKLTATRPAMAPIYNIISRLLGVIDRKAKRTELDSVRQLIISRAEKVINESLEAVDQVARNSSRLIANGDRIMTHSYSSTVVAALKEVSTKYHDIEVIITRAGPGRSGERTARELGERGMTLTFIDDTASGLYISKVNKAIVGADRICADGGVVNGAGTYQLALASEKAGVPFYVLCETLKFDSRLKSGEIELEEKEPGEVADLAVLPPNTSIKNPYFDITPLELITAVVTENGMFTAKRLEAVWRDTLARRR
jgi:ribose 1,5-bisphosphate isomerase